MSEAKELEVRKKLQQAVEAGDEANELILRRMLVDMTPQEARMPADTSIDKRTGAPAGVRGMVGPEYRKPEDRLATLQQFYPDAQYYNDDNFVFTENGRPRLYNPSGLDVGDISENARILPEGLGGVAGGAVAVGAGNPFMVPIGVGLGAEAGGQMYDLFMNLSGQVDTRSTPERFAQGATGVGINAVGQKLAGDVPVVGRRMLAGARNRLAGRTPPQVLQDMQMANMALEGGAGMVAGSRPIQNTQMALANLPTSANRMRDAADATMGSMERYKDDVIRQSGGRPYTNQELGERLQEGAAAGVAKFKARRELLDENVESLIGARTPVNIGNTRQLVDELRNAVQQKTNSHLIPVLRTAEEAIADADAGKMTFGALRSFRTRIGKMLDDINQAEHLGAAEATTRRLYGALADDVRAAADAAGPRASRALQLHNRYVRMARLNKDGRDIGSMSLYQDILRKDAEDVTKFVMNKVKGGGEKLRRLRRSMPATLWDDVVATSLENLGRATPGKQSAAGDVFSVNTFLTNWNKMSPEAKRVLTSGKKYADLRVGLDRLVRLAGAAKDVEQMRNFSNTSQQLVYMALLTGGGGLIGGSEGGGSGALAGAAAAAMTPAAVAKLMTSPKFVSWLGTAMRIPAENYQARAAHLGRLAAVAAADEDIRTEVRQYQNALRAVSGPESASVPAGPDVRDNRQPAQPALQ